MGRVTERKGERDTEMGTVAPLPNFVVYGLRPYKRRPMSVVAKRLDGSGCHLV